MIPQLRRVGQRAAIYALVRQEMLAEVLEQRLGEYDWSVDLRARRFVFSSERGRITATGQVLASIALNPASLLWGFAAPFAPYVGQNSAASRISIFGARHGLEVFQREEVGYEVEPGENQVELVTTLSHDVGMAATEIFGPRILYYSGATGTAGSRQVFLLEDLSVPLPDLTLNRLFPSLTRYVMAVDDIDWSLHGLVHLMPGWSLSREDIGATTGYRIANTTGQSYTLSVTRGEQGEIANVFMS
ncbi:hypothetical protein J5X07_10975 [Actinomyces bowdenii]|uniref:DUF6882 domain-containing protein n=1 Tax=Actinomyces bowdenii TaxID=131109 RepID=UPI001ABC4C20|nr:DUF6882 domain-containing protein [Actinomyces bowdenii]MBO3725539.1 hypothetical protein [Actinomyces bowdenii]